MDELEALLALAHVPHLGSIKIRLLLRHYGSAQNALAADPNEIAQLPGFYPQVIAAFTQAMQERPWHRTLDLLHRHSAYLVTFEDSRYPKGLLELNDYPVLLYVKGELKPQDVNSIAVIGTRQASIYGKEMAEMLSRDLVHQGFCIVSGLARGIDTHAHQAALNASGRTIAVIGSGLADIYPQENEILAKTIATNGALISEFPMATPPDRQNFPQRNRLVATMTRGTLLIEAPEKSGAMITVSRALAHKRPVFAIPGRADSEAFRGNHSLIKTGQAQLVENANDIASTFTDLFKPMRLGAAVTKNEIPLEPEEKSLLQSMPAEELSIDELIDRTKLPVMKLNVLLMSLILKRMIKEYPGKVFKKVS